MNAMIARPRYTEWLSRWKDKDLIKVVTGLRRCGKSSVLALFRSQLLEAGVNETNIISINFESLDQDYPREAKPLYDYIVSQLGPGKNYVFLDEVQHVANFERAVDGLFVREDVDVYITGSNAYFLSGDLATLLTGRYVELRMLPLSFAEYRCAFPSNISDDDLFNRYLNYGGLPFTVQLTDDQSIADYLGGVFNTVILEDVARRHPRMNMRSFIDTASFLADNVGNITSRKKISSGLTAAGAKTSPTTVGEYLDALLENYLIFRANRYDLKGKEYLGTLEKYYLGDLGFRFWLLGKNQNDVGHRLENVVCLELLRRYRRVDIGKVSTKEVDFVATDGQSTHYFQVSMSVLDEDTLARELAPLRALSDNYPKTLLTLDRIGVGDIDGIQNKNLVDWLLECS